MGNGEKEVSIERYFVKVCKASGWETRKLQWVGRRGAADRIVFKGHGVIEFVELKRPKGGIVSVHQSEDANLLTWYGVKKHFLYTREAVDTWVAKMSESVPYG